MYSKKETIKVKLEDLKPHPKNPKLHNDKLIEKSINDLGYAENIVIDENNMILAGHGRVNAMKKKGIVEDEAIRITGWTEEEKEKYLLLANQSTILGGFDDVKLKDFTGDILDFAGLDADILIEPDEKDDIVPENVPPVAKLGDLWALGRHRLLCGDATKIEDVERLMDGKKADMVFTDPPYNVDYKGMQNSKQWDSIANDAMNPEQFSEFLYKVFNNYNDFTKDGGAMYICHADKSHIEFRRAFERAGYDWRATIIWEKNSPAFNFAQYKYKHEPIFYCYKKGKTVGWYGDRKQNTIWKAKKEKGEHPTIKPVELITNAVMNSSKQEDIIIDLFGGSGSTLIACEQMKRKCYMMELDPKYTDVIIKRWELFTGLKAQKL